MSSDQSSGGSGPGARPNAVTSLSLLHRARGNDQEAWRRLFFLYRPLVLYWCARGSIRSEDAEDVCQEVFRAASTGLASFRHDRPGDTFRGWLRGITRHMIQQHFRRQTNQAKAAGGSDALERLQGVRDPQDLVEDDPAEQVSGLYRRALELVRSEFEDRTWQMFWLTVIDTRSTAAVATDLGVTTAAVRKAKSRVLRRLKEEAGDLIQ